MKFLFKLRSREPQLYVKKYEAMQFSMCSALAAILYITLDANVCS